MTVSDTHADTIREALNEGERVLNAVWEQWWRSRSGSSDASLAHAVANLDLERATEALDAFLAEIERERARADRAEAALAEAVSAFQAEVRMHTRAMREGSELRRALVAVSDWVRHGVGKESDATEAMDAALSAGSGGRETTP